MSAIRVALTAACVVIWMVKATLATPSLPLFLANPDGGAIRALIIGINAYQHVRQLKGSVADARDIEGALRSMGTTDIVTLTDGQASRAAILQSISDLVERTNANDQIILSIAGHGAQEPETIKGSEFKIYDTSKPPNGVPDVAVTEASDGSMIVIVDPDEQGTWDEGGTCQNGTYVQID